MQANFQELADFLTRRCQTLEAVARRSQSIQVSTNSRQAGTLKTIASHAAITNTKCNYCKGNHQIYYCKQFQGLSASERSNQIKLKGLCLNCLKGKHLAKDCLGRTCKICEKRHNTLLHDDRDISKGHKQEQENQAVTHNSELSKSDNVVCNHSQLIKMPKSS